MKKTLCKQINDVVRWWRAVRQLDKDHVSYTAGFKALSFNKINEDKMHVNVHEKPSS